MHQNSAGASENMQADYKARNALSIHANTPPPTSPTPRSTRTGLMKGSHSSFFAHHLCCISESVVGQEVVTIHAHAVAMASRADHDLD